MIIRGIEEHDLWAALDVANYAYLGNLCFREGPDPLMPRRESWRVRLGVKDPDEPGHRHWVPRSWWDQAWWDRRAKHPGSACYHAHRDFFYAIFERAPQARAVTALDLYEGLADFEARYRRVASLNVGSFFEPVRFEDCCDCLRRFPRIETMVPEPYLGDYALEENREIYSGLNTDERKR